MKKQATGFTQVSNKILNDKNISWKAKGLWAYLFSKPNDWDFSGKRIAKDGVDGVRATYSGLKELEENGYIERERKENGRSYYYVRYDKTALCQNRKKLKPQKAKTAPISNKEIKVIKSISNKEKGFIEKLNENQKEKWNEWKEYRKEINKKMTDRTISMQINLLEENLPNLESIINTSIQNGWTGLFEQKESYNNQSAGVIRFNK